MDDCASFLRPCNSGATGGVEMMMMLMVVVVVVVCRSERFLLGSLIPERSGGEIMVDQ